MMIQSTYSLALRQFSSAQQSTLRGYLMRSLIEAYYHSNEIMKCNYLSDGTERELNLRKIPRVKFIIDWPEVTKLNIGYFFENL